jgi:CRISPR-associated protein Csx17
MKNELVLQGCTPTPLASYLKALGVLRLVAEAGADVGGDPEATGFWRNDMFVLRTRLTNDELRAFFLERYRPTPLLAPWNGGSGFYFQEGKLKEKDPVTGKKLKTGVRDQETEATKTVAAIEQSTSQRFADYRDAIAIARRVIADFKIVEAPENTSKCSAPAARSAFATATRHALPAHRLSQSRCCYLRRPKRGADAAGRVGTKHGEST